MKLKQTFLALLGLVIYLNGISQDCENAQTFTKLEVNQVKSGLMPNAALWDFPGENGYQVPRDKEYYNSNLGLILGGIWMGGFDPVGNLKVAAQTYGSAQGNTDYWPGPIVNGTTSKEACKNWDRFFRIKKSEVENHLNVFRQFDQLGLPVPEYLIPEALKSWPGNGNPYFESENGFALAGGYYDFYFDKNQNGVYEPQLGEYPAIETKTGDQLVPDEMVYWVFNDIGNIHNESNGESIGVEVHALAYAFAEPGNLNYSQFYTYKIINKSPDRLEDFRFGLWVDPEVGCYNRNMAGCDSTRSLAFFYSPEIDPPNCPLSTEDTFPMLGVDFLDVSVSGTSYGYRPMETFGYYNSAAIGNTMPASTEPQTAQEFYYYLIGLNRAGNPLDNNGVISTFAFPSSPDCTDPATCWNMCLDTTMYFLRRTIQATGPVTLQPNTSMEVNFATLYTDEIDYPCPGNQSLVDKSDELQRLYDDGFQPLLLSKETYSGAADLKAFPNPIATSRTALFIDNLPDEPLELEIRNIHGRVFQKYSKRKYFNGEIQLAGQLSPGTYLLVLKTKQYTPITIKLIVIE